MNVPVDHDDRVYLVGRHVEGYAALQGFAAEYAQPSESCSLPAIVATLRTAEEFA